MASGIATVTTDVGGCSEVVENGVTGIVVPPNDGIAIQAAVKKLLVDDGAPGLRQAMGAEGRKRASQNFSLEHQVQQLAEWYQEYVAR
jgi:glycosyltransferase involved in cell wall biosynthesis